ncbi:MAG: N-6 DNA methylase [Gammaproteobacteria bacterium]|nr:N-6 DNA methylase [Gammaproteobacteria bacterium]
MTAASVEKWLDGLGYADEPDLLHRRGETVSPQHSYALEIHALLQHDGSVRARAVFDVEGVPTIVVLDGDNQNGAAGGALDEARKRIWNQNLATVVIHIQGDEALAVPARRLEAAERRLRFDEVRRDGPFSASDVGSANLTRRIPEWFDQNARVDHKLLDNISTAVGKLATTGFRGVDDERKRQRLAELLMGEILFVSYLEHREIVGETYRARRDVGRLLDLVGSADGRGIKRLFDALRSDFNGDFLAEDSHDPWAALAEPAYELLDQFLRRTDMRTGQGDFWNYDFSYIPVELLSGLYEMFLSPSEQTSQGAFYTPRHLAVLAVNQAFENSPNPLSETVFDGACGSGILLTTAYRRLIALAEQQRGRPLAFRERCDLLKRTIFGGDINPMACRVTAFSLYLSIFEGLEPSDIMEAQERDDADLPTLKGSNLATGPAVGDFFKSGHAFAGKQFSVVISNPPWREPEGVEQTTADQWADRTGEPFVRRQIAGAYALRALDFVEPGGRACLVLPIAQLLGDTSATFVARLLQRYRPLRIVNFGDLQELLFPTATHACHLFTGQRRTDDGLSAVPFRETFDYCVPKADLALAFGHLTMQSADLHRLQTLSIAEDPQDLVSLMWGDANDIAIWTRLTARGTFAGFARSAPARSQRACRKGVTATTTAEATADEGFLRSLPHIDPDALSLGSPTLHEDLLGQWPQQKHPTNPLTEPLKRVFDGPRVLFPDGFSQRQPNVRACYYDGRASFTHSVGVIASTDERDSPLLKFIAVYLRSSLVQYFLTLHTWKILGSRGGIHLTDIKAFPFFGPDAAPDPAAARNALAVVSRHMDEMADLPAARQPVVYRDLRSDLDRLVYAYFGLTRKEQALVQETVDVVMPSIRPRSFGSLDTPAQRTVRLSDYTAYANALGQSLTEWRTRMGGQGRFRITVRGSTPGRDGPTGVVRVVYVRNMTAEPEIDAVVDDAVVLQVLESLRSAGLRRIWSAPTLSLVPDTHIWLDGSLYLVRPATKRNWTIRQALRDAEHIVRLVQPDSGT